MKCPYCGIENQEGAQYCFRCGRTLTSNNTAASPASVAAAGAEIPQVQVKKSTYKKWVFIVVGIILLPLALVFAAGMFASFFEAAVTDEQTFSETQTMPLDIVPGSYVSPDGSFSVVFPGVLPEAIQVASFEDETSNSAAHFVETANDRYTVSELHFKQPIHALDQRAFLEQWAAGYAAREGGPLVVAEFKDEEYLTLDIAVKGRTADTVARMLLVNDSVAYMLEYKFLPSFEPDVMAYTNFTTSFRYLRQ